MRARARQIERAIGELEARLGRAPTDEEIADRVGITVDELDGSLEGHLALVDRGARRALVDLGRGRPGLAARHDRGPDSIKPADALDEAEVRETLADAIARLPEREKIVITLYYYEELTLARSARCSA